MSNPAKRPPIYFLRHGETDWNKDRRLQGQIDIPLNETGLGQAARMAAKLREVLPDIGGFKLTASPLGRARQTMDAVLEVYGLTRDSVTYDDRLQELSFGDAEGMTWPELDLLGVNRDVDPEGYHDWRTGGGESYDDGRGRVGEWLGEISSPTVVVAHGGISRIVRGLVFDLPKAEIVSLKVPQDRFFRIQDGGLDWFDARDVAT